MEEMPEGLNFEMSIVICADLYYEKHIYKIKKISNWHKHYKYKYYDNFSRYKLSTYLHLLDNVDNLQKISECKCLLSDKQMELYNLLKANL